MWDSWNDLEASQQAADKRMQERLDADAERRRLREPGQPIQPSRIIEGEAPRLRVVPEPPLDALQAAETAAEAVAATPARTNPLPPLRAKPAPQPVDRSRGLRLILADLLDTLKGPKP